MYGLGLVARSTRYTSSGSAAHSASKRCDTTTWKASPARICSFTTSTAAWCSAGLRRRVNTGSEGRYTATVDAEGADSSAVIRSSRVTASS